MIAVCVCVSGAPPCAMRARLLLPESCGDMLNKCRIFWNMATSDSFCEFGKQRFETVWARQVLLPPLCKQHPEGSGFDFSRVGEEHTSNNNHISKHACATEPHSPHNFTYFELSLSFTHMGTPTYCCQHPDPFPPIARAKPTTHLALQIGRNSCVFAGVRKQISCVRNVASFVAQVLRVKMCHGKL